MSIKIFWTPAGVTLDTIREKRLVDISDGDTPNIRMNVRMLSIDTPEKRALRASRNLDPANAAFQELAEWLKTGDAPATDALAQHLIPRLERADGAATAHVAQGVAATEAHEALSRERLRRPTGSVRPLFVRIADQPFDRFGRLLAYVAPSYSAEERQAMTRAERATFNLLMIENGWAAPFILFPNIPGELDLPLAQAAGRRAIAERRGAWADPLALTGYELRSCERLVEIMRKVKSGKRLSGAERFGWIYRYCADMTTRADLRSARLYPRRAGEPCVHLARRCARGGRRTQSRAAGGLTGPPRLINSTPSSTRPAPGA